MKRFFTKYFDRATIKSLLLMVITAWLMGFPTMLLWNDLAPSIQGVEPISYTQAVSLYFLAAILGRANSLLFDD